MLNENAKQWVAALRSGEYKQGKEFLRNGDEWCCLGVLCDVATKAGFPIAVSLSKDGVYSFGQQSAVLPDEVQRWAGLKDRLGRFSIGDSLVDRNDEGQPFAEIADIIESEPAGLFAERR